MPVSRPIDSNIDPSLHSYCAIVYPLSEDEVVAFIRCRLENGDLAVQDIPVRLARYGLMQPQAFIEEMRERKE